MMKIICEQICELKLYLLKNKSIFEDPLTGIKQQACRDILNC